VLLFGLLACVPPGASLILGVLYVWTAEVGRAIKFATAVTFVTALYLQFLSPWPLAGLLIQIVLALGLELRRRAVA
jgi:hypothetical protein